MNAKLLSTVLRKHSQALREIVDPDTGAPTPFNFDTYQLLCALARIVEGQSIAQSFGAPGAWGYDHPIGQALAARAQAEEDCAQQVPAKEYIEMPVSAARDLAQRYGKSALVIMCMARSQALFHITTWGDAPDSKLLAASMGEVCAIAIGTDLSKAKSFEDFRHRDAAAWAVEKDQLLKELAAARGEG